MVIRLPGFSDSQNVLLASDLHLGARDTDIARIKEDFDWAKKNKARILINGDVFDAIFHTDKKRFVPSVPIDEIAKSDSPLNAACDYASKILRPYADLIDVIGVGNHESKMQKYHGMDAMAFLLDRLNGYRSSKLQPISHGGYTGYVVIPYTLRGRNHVEGHYVIWYHHGMGGSAPVSKGLIDFARASSHVRDADALWLGHKHNKYAVGVKELRCRPRSAESYYHDVWHIMTGAYSGEGSPQVDDTGSYAINWARECGFAPQGTGGVRLKLNVVRDQSKNGKPEFSVSSSVEMES